MLHDARAHFNSRPPRLIQWDSWRFWEGLAAGCLVFNFDLPLYGVRLPVMPEPFVHYVPVRANNSALAGYFTAPFGVYLNFCPPIAA